MPFPLQNRALFQGENGARRWWPAEGAKIRSLGPPQFRKNALGVKRPFSELSESSGAFSEQLSEFRMASPQNSGRKLLPEICVKKGQNANYRTEKHPRPRNTMFTVVSNLITDRDFLWGELISHCRYRIELPEELISITETDLWDFQQKVSHYRYRFFL